MGTLTERRAEAGEAANAALKGELSEERRQQVEELLETQRACPPAPPRAPRLSQYLTLSARS